ncbi:MAG TPA: hypothetical protein VF223_19140 [Trebonia sp.]
MAALTVQSAPHAGLNPVAMTPGLAGVSGHTAPCGNGLALLLVNGAAATCVVTLHVPAATTFDGLVIPNRTVTLPATSGAITLIPLVPSTYADPVTGLATFDVAAGTVSGAVIVQA